MSPSIKEPLLHKHTPVNSLPGVISGGMGQHSCEHRQSLQWLQYVAFAGLAMYLRQPEYSASKTIFISMSRHS